MEHDIDPREYNLPARTVLERINQTTLAIVIQRKSRIIMADGMKIVEKARKIREARPGIVIVLKTSAPICSKTAGYFASEGIAVEALAD